MTDTTIKERAKWEEEFETVCSDAAYFNDGLLDADSRSRIKDFIRKKLAGTSEETREKCLAKARQIVGSHESPHTESNCRLCRLENAIANLDFGV